MMKLEDLNGKKILIVGLGRTGVSLAKFLVKHKVEVTITDHKSKPELVNALESLEGYDVNYDLGRHSPKTFLRHDLIVLSPGINPQLKIFDYARKNGVKVTGEFEFATQFIEEPIIAVTGTNGKTTTCKLIELFLKESGKKVWLGGNYGLPTTEHLLQKEESKEKFDVVIMEVSSFMLEHIESFCPSIVVFTNLAENHLDRHKTMEGYISAKRRIFLNTNQNSTSILNADDNAVVELARDPAVQRGRIFYFSRKPSLEPQIMNIGGAVNIDQEIRVRTGPQIQSFSIKNLRMRGQHSIENFMAAMLAASEYGATTEAITSIMEKFRGISHRLEYVRKVGGVEFYNDSKATNVHSVLCALESFGENVILIAGGKDTNLNYEPLRHVVRQKVKTLILVGEAKEKINRDIGDESETFLIGTFEEAVHVAFQKSRIGDKVLLSPGCSSFDLFDSYIERGQYFKEIVSTFK